MNVLRQIHFANRNKNIAMAVGVIAFFSLVGFTIYYVKYQSLMNEFVDIKSRQILLQSQLIQLKLNENKISELPNNDNLPTAEENDETTPEIQS